MTTTIISLILLIINAGIIHMSRIGLIKRFVGNEWAPTILHYHLCWGKATQIRLIKELNADGFRVSSSMKPHGEQQDHNLLFLGDLSCPESEQSFKVPSLLRFPYRWLVLSERTDNNTNGGEIPKGLLDLPLLADSDFVLAEGTQLMYRLTELHKASPNGATISHPRGIFDGTYLDVRPRRELFCRRKDLMGHPLTMSNVIQDSNTSVYHLPREDRLLLHHDSLTKLCWIHVRTAFSMLNATPKYIFSYRWGYMQDGQWSGMINDLRIGRAEIGTNCVANSKRLEVAAFSDSIARFKVKFVFRRPPLSSVANIFALPFSAAVWLATALTAALAAAALSLAGKWEVRRSGVNPNRLDGSVGDALLLTMSALSQQGCSKEPKGLAGRIMLWVIFAALMALYAAYSANIVVLLQAPSPALRTVEQLSASGITLGALDTDYNRFVFRMFNDTVRAPILKKIEPPKGKPHYYGLSEGVEKIRQGFFAFHAIVEPVHRRAEETFLEMEKCDLSEVDFMDARDPLVPIYKRSPYLELLRVALKRVRESGIQSALHGRYQVPKPKCGHRITAFSSVSLMNLRPALYFMLYGCLVSIFLLGLEIIVTKIYR